MQTGQTGLPELNYRRSLNHKLDTRCFMRFVLHNNKNCIGDRYSVFLHHPKWMEKPKSYYGIYEVVAIQQFLFNGVPEWLCYADADMSLISWRKMYSNFFKAEVKDFDQCRLDLLMLQCVNEATSQWRKELHNEIFGNLKTA